jgi:hypothetical protein
VSFELRKWYFDCVGADGEVFIGYRAGLRWKSLSLAYASFFSRKAGEKTGLSRFTLGPGAEPTPELSLAVPRLGLEGRWEPTQPAADAVLHEEGGGKVHWSCLAPAARAALTLKGRSSLSGPGYAELMRLSLAPWKLPIRELRWGRFVSEGGALSLVWIDWRGSLPLTRVYIDGKIIPEASVTDRNIQGRHQGQEFRLTLATDDPLIEGKLTMTALKGVPGIKKVLPKAITDLHQCKWLSWGQLERTGRAATPGWIIHEVVLWP